MTLYDGTTNGHPSLNDLCIRQVTRDDLQRLECGQMFIHFRNVFFKSFVEQQFGDRHMLIAEVNAELIGRLFVLHRRSQLERPPKQRRGYLYSFYVLESYRGLGIGSALLRAAEAHLRQMSFHTATISVARTNYNALRLYRRHGYQIISADNGEWSYLDHHDVLRKVTEPCYLLEKILHVP